MSGRLKLKSIYPTFEEFSTFCMDTIIEFYPRLVTDMPNSEPLRSEIERYVFKPLYRQFKNATCRYLPTEEGIDAFNNQFSNQLEEVVFDFLIYTSTNLVYFNESYTKVGENLEQGVTTYNSPINQDIENTKSNTTIAKGATSQSINLMVYNGNTSWLKAFSSYYTPQRKAELIDKFRWLFISFYVGSDEGVTLIELSEALSMANGDMVITPEEAEILRKVIIEKPSTLIPENIKKGVDIGGVIGTLEEGGENSVSKVFVCSLIDNEIITFNIENVLNYIIEKSANKQITFKLNCILKSQIGSMSMTINGIAVDGNLAEVGDKSGCGVYVYEESLSIKGNVNINTNINYNTILNVHIVHKDVEISKLMRDLISALYVNVEISEVEDE